MEKVLEDGNTTNINPHEMSQRWGMFMQGIDDLPAMTRTNLALFEVAPVEGYKERIQFAVYYQDQTDSGLPTAEENTKLWEIEDAAMACINSLDVIDVGLMKWNNRVNFFMYAKNPEGIENTLAKMLKEQFPQYTYQLWVDEDDSWECYFETLYPNKYSMQEISNNQVLQALENDGDDFSKERTIEHWAYFKTREEADQFISGAEAESFPLS